MKVTPITMKQANEFVRNHHRHHGNVQGCKLSVRRTMTARFSVLLLSADPFQDI